MSLDKEALLAEIDRRADHHNLLIHAVLAGLAKRIRRGDFDQREEDDLALVASDVCHRELASGSYCAECGTYNPGDDD